MTLSQTASSEQDLVNLSVRVPRATAEALKAIADREFRPVAAEIRRLINERVEADRAATTQAA